MPKDRKRLSIKLKPRAKEPKEDEVMSEENKEITAVENSMELVKEEESVVKEVYLPGRSRPLEEDEELVMDKSAYRMFFEMQVESASLSFDVLLDNLGYDRPVEVNGDPISACLIAGTQADKDISNKLVVMRLSNLIPYKRKAKDPQESDNDDSDSDSDSSSDEDLDSQPEIDAATILHDGTVNRVRAHQFGGRYLAASWSENKKVFIWDLTRPLTAVNDSAVMSEYTMHDESPTPVFTFQGHRSEGFALDWGCNPLSSGYLASGDGTGRIHHWAPRASDWVVSSKPYTGHTGSVEDIQWSPTEPTVFISVSSDKSIRVWDIRAPNASRSMLTVPEAHPADINVAAWSRLQPVNLLTGGDDGSLRVWDLRLINKNYGGRAKATIKSVPAYTHLFDFHSKPITSVEWHPTDPGMFVATSEDNQVSFWDINLEQAEYESKNNDISEATETSNLPVQLLFIHTGQTEIKEAHWHKQLPGLVLTTSLDGFNIFRTCNI